MVAGAATACQCVSSGTILAARAGRRVLKSRRAGEWTISIAALTPGSSPMQFTCVNSRLSRFLWKPVLMKRSAAPPDFRPAGQGRIQHECGKTRPSASGLKGKGAFHNNMARWEPAQTVEGRESGTQSCGFKCRQLKEKHSKKPCDQQVQRADSGVMVAPHVKHAVPCLHQACRITHITAFPPSHHVPHLPTTGCSCPAGAPPGK